LQTRNYIHDTAATFFKSIQKHGAELTAQGLGP